MPVGQGEGGFRRRVGVEWGMPVWVGAGGLGSPASWGRLVLCLGQAGQRLGCRWGWGGKGGWGGVAGRGGGGGFGGGGRGGFWVAGGGGGGRGGLGISAAWGQLVICRG